MSAHLHASFEYDHEKYELVEGKKSENTVQINGVTYSILGPTEKMKEVRDALNALSLTTVTSQSELKEKLSSSGKIPASSVKEIRAKHFGQSKEVESLPSSKAPLKRTTSHGSIDKLSNKNEELSKKSSILWDCVDRTPDKHSNGYIYKFRMKSEFDSRLGSTEAEQDEIAQHLNAVTKSIFPANEPTLMDVYGHFFGNIPDQKVLNDLGYSFEITPTDIYLSCPDGETLMSRWENLRETRPELPKLEIASSAGIADDNSFILAYFTHDAILSDGAEFLHDHDGHILEIISYIFTSLEATNLKKGSKGINYGEDKTQLLRTLASFYKKLAIVERGLEDGQLNLPKNEVNRIKMEVEKLKASIATLTDNSAGDALSRYKNTQNASNWMRGQYSDEYREYLDKRFGLDVMDRENVVNGWNIISEIERKIKDLQKQKPPKDVKKHL